MPRRIAQPRYRFGKFLDPCYWCKKVKCQESHSDEIIQYKKKLHTRAMNFLSSGRRLVRGVYKKAFNKVLVQKPVGKRQKYITFTKQEMKNIKNYKPRYLPTTLQEERLKENWWY
jgi:hypothetical protein